MKFQKGARLLAALVCVLALGACDLKLGDEVGPSQTVIIGATPTPTPVAAASPGQSGEAPLPAGSYVRVGIFGRSGATCGALANSSPIVPIGCMAFVTCTPKDAAGNDLPIAVHGPNAAWAVVGEGVTVQTSQPSEPFNRDVRGLSAGVARLTCTVKGAQGALDLVIQ